MEKAGTYVYCLIAASRRPSLRRFRRLPGMGPVRLLDVGERWWLAVADASLARYGEKSINRKLSDLDWVSRAAMAHEAVVESFIDQEAVLPMKLFTIFSSDDRALQHVRGDRRRVTAIVRRVAGQLEWGVRVTLDKDRQRASRRRSRIVTRTGVDYLRLKKTERDEAMQRAGRARESMHGLFRRLRARARLARRRAPGDFPVHGGALVLDAAFLVPRSGQRGFRTLVAREAKRLGPLGYDILLSGPWPPYTFVKD